MDTILYGSIAVVLAFALMTALVYLGEILRQRSELKLMVQQLHQDKCGLTKTLNSRQERINKLKAELQSANETIRDQETLIQMKDDELTYNDQYMQSQLHVLELSQKEVADLQKSLAAADSPEYLKACLLENIQQLANLKHLNELLENANASYAADLKLIKSEFQAMMARINATEFDQIRSGEIDPDAELKQAEYRPDLGPDDCTHQPQAPDESMESQQVSACF